MAERMTDENLEKERGFLYYLGKDGYVWRSPMRNNPKGRKGKVGRERFSRENGFLYFVDRKGYVARAKMNRRGRISGSGSSRRSAGKSSRRSTRRSAGRGRR